MWRLWILLLLPFVFSANVTVIEDSAIKQVLHRYNRFAYPGTEDNPVVKVTHSLSITRIVEFGDRNLIIDAWLGMEWADPRLTWDGLPENIRLPADSIWTPDIVLYNNPSDRYKLMPLTMIHATGLAFHLPVARLETNNCRALEGCLISCSFKFGSWTYSGFQIDLQSKSQTVDLSNYEAHDTYEIYNTSATRNEVFYPCCPDTYPDITYTIILKP